MKLSLTCNWLLFIACIVSIPVTFAGEVCDDRSPINTPYGDLVRRICRENGRSPTYEVLLSGKTLIKANSLFEEDRNSKKSVWIYSGEWNGRNAMFLLDISKSPPKVFVFGVTMATNEFDYAS